MKAQNKLMGTSENPSVITEQIHRLHFSTGQPALMLVDAGWQTRIEAAHYFFFFVQCKVKNEGYKNLESCIRSLTHWQVMGFCRQGGKQILKLQS